MQQVDRSQLDLSPYHSWGDTTTLVERFCGRLKCTCSSAIECWRRGSSRLLRARLTPTSRMGHMFGLCGDARPYRDRGRWRVVALACRIPQRSSLWGAGTGADKNAASP